MGGWTYNLWWPDRELPYQDSYSELKGAWAASRLRDSIGGTAEFTNHISTYKEGVGRDGSPEGFDSNGGTVEFANHIST